MIQFTHLTSPERLWNLYIIIYYTYICIYIKYIHLGSYIHGPVPAALHAHSIKSTGNNIKIAIIFSSLYHCNISSFTVVILFLFTPPIKFNLDTYIHIINIFNDLINHLIHYTHETFDYILRSEEKS